MKTNSPQTNLSSLKKTARQAGFLYLAWILTGLFGILYISPQFNVPGDVAATAQNLLTKEILFRTGMMNDLISIIICVFLLFALYRLLKPVNELQAKLMVALLSVTIPVFFILEAFNIASLMILKGEMLKTFGIPVLADDTGGNFGRSIEFYSENGKLLIKTIGHGTKTL